MSFKIFVISHSRLFNKNFCEIPLVKKAGEIFWVLKNFAQLLSNCLFRGIKKISFFRKNYCPNFAKWFFKRPLGLRHSYEVNEKFHKRPTKSKNFLEKEKFF